MNQDISEKSHAEIMTVIGALMLAMLLAALDQTIVSTALTTIANDLHGLNKLPWVATAYLLTSAVVTPLYGKLGDMLGRKRIFQIAIVLFLLGSALCGAAHTMNQLVFFRALQGLGGGGLISLALAIIGDVVPPRQRGRYQGYFGAVFGISSVLGPLLGGLITEHISWRWIFYVNLPIGILALIVIATRLHLPKLTSPHRFDYAGAGLLALSVVPLLLGLTWGGSSYPWASGHVIGAFIITAIATIGLLLRERKAAEPIIPLSLFKERVFNVSALLSLIVGVLLLGTIIFLPEYQQIVRGDSPTKSGLLLLPFVAGLFTASISSGRIISRIGKYRIFPIIGTVIVSTGIWLFTHISLGTTQLELSIWMVITGFGLGSFMQVMTLAVQNSAPRKLLGTATSIVTFSRSLGSSIGTAVFGTILTSRLATHLAHNLPSNATRHGVRSSQLMSNASQIHHLPVAVQHPILLSFTQSFHDVFLVALPFGVLAFIVALFLKESPLRGAVHQEAEADIAGM